MIGNRRGRRRARFESLEGRQLLAGDVVVSLERGDLIVEGDEMGNQIAITAGAEAGAYLITGLEGTTVHLEGEPPAASVMVAGVRDDVKIELGDGNDTVILSDAGVRGSVSIHTGEGDDQVVAGAAPAMEVGAVAAGVLPEDVSLAVKGSLGINTDGGNDQISVDDVAVRGSLSIRAGDDDDEVALGGLMVEDNVEATVLGENGGDPQFDARLRVGASINVRLGDGNDMLAMHQVSARSHVHVDAGAGDDSVDVGLSQAFSMTVFGDDGADSLNVDGLRARHLSFFAGAGNDRFEVVDSAFSSLSTFLGEGDDELVAMNVEARFALLLGGLGEDMNTLVDTDFMFDIIDGFELPAPAPVAPPINMTGRA